MKTTSFNAAHAAALGFPATLQGFTPDEKGYWYEPNLPFMPPAEFKEASKSRAYAGYFILDIKGAGMGPRFPEGTRVVAAPIVRRSEIGAGVYSWQWRDKKRGVLLSGFGRLKAIHPDRLVLAQDVGGQESECPLLWKDPDFALFLVDYYVSVPSR